MTDYLIYNHFTGFLFIRVNTEDDTKAKIKLSRYYGDFIVRLPFKIKNIKKIIVERVDN